MISSECIYGKTNTILGEGADGIVYRGINKATKEDVAIKEISINPDVGLTPNIFREITFLGKAKNTVYQNSNIVDMKHVYLENNNIFIVMELGTKTLLEDIKYSLDTKKFVNDETKVCDIVNSVEHVNRLGYVHGDLSLNNFVLCKTGIKLIDFARTVRKHRYMDAKIIPNSFSCPPEITNSNKIANPYCIDIWAVGCILFCIVSKEPLNYNNNHEHVAQKLKETDLGTRIGKYIKKMLDHNHTKRKKLFSNIFTDLTKLSMSEFNKMHNTKVIKLYHVNANFGENDRVKLIKYIYDFNIKYRISQETLFLTIDNINRLTYYDLKTGIIMFCMMLNIVINAVVAVTEVNAIIKDFSKNDAENTSKSIIEKQMKIMEDLSWDIDPDTIFTDITKLYDKELKHTNSTMKQSYIDMGILSYVDNRIYGNQNSENIVNIIDTAIQVYYSDNKSQKTLLSDKAMIVYQYLQDLNTCIDEVKTMPETRFYDLFLKTAKLK